MISPAMRNELAAVAKRAGAARAMKLLEAEALECAYLFESPRKAPRTGGSRVGGLPDLPKSVEWPTGLNEAGKPSSYASFLAQFDLSDIPALEGFPLPRKGMLWLFLRAWLDQVYVAAIYDADPATLAPRAAPTAKDRGHASRLLRAPAPLRFKRGISLPLYRLSFHDELQAAGGTGDIGAVFGAAIPEDAGGQVGGYSVIPEENLYRTVAFRQLGRPDAIFADYWKSVAEYEKSLDNPPFFVKDKKAFRASREKLRPNVEWIHANRDRIDAETASWRLLARFSSGIGGLELGDGTSMDLFIRADDLAAGRFDRVVGECPMVT